MPSVADLTVPAGRRRPLPWTGMLLAVLAGGAALTGAAVLPQPWRAFDHRLLQALQRPALAGVVVLLAVHLAAVALKARAVRELPAVRSEEPLLGPPGLATSRRPARVVTLAGLQAGCGVSTLAFNAAVSLAVHGRRLEDGRAQPVRPACLLAEGSLTRALGLSPRALEEHVAQRPYQESPAVVNLAVHHPSGCALFCLKGAEREGDAVPRLVREMTRHYDAVLVDGAIAVRRLTEIAADLSDFLLLVGLPADASVELAGRWIERVWGMGLESRTGLILNRAAAWPPPRRELIIAFHYLALLPEEPQVPGLDRRGLPWSLDERLAASGQLVEIVRQLFPALAHGDGPRAA